MSITYEQIYADRTQCLHKQTAMQVMGWVLRISGDDLAPCYTDLEGHTIPEATWQPTVNEAQCFQIFAACLKRQKLINITYGPGLKRPYGIEGERGKTLPEVICKFAVRLFSENPQPAVLISTSPG